MEMDLDTIVTWLYSRKRRATYGAVAALLGKTPRELMSGRPPRNQKYSWIVALTDRKEPQYRPDGSRKEKDKVLSRRGQPTGDKHHLIDPECYQQFRKGLDNVIRDKAGLSPGSDGYEVERIPLF